MGQADIADRLSILGIKMERGLKGIESEIRALLPFCHVSPADMAKLHRVNLEGWEANQHMFDHLEGKAIMPDHEFVAWAAKAHAANKERIAIKNHISRLFSESEERKTWLAR